MGAADSGIGRVSCTDLSTELTTAMDDPAAEPRDAIIDSHTTPGATGPIGSPRLDCHLIGGSAMPFAVIDSPLGPIGIHWQGAALTAVDLEPTDPAADTLTEVAPPEPIARQLAAYFAHASTPFDLPLELGGTPFQQRVWALLRAIPVGETRTYGEVARQLGSAARAVGQACRANPCPIVVPCHRVVAVQGLGGFAGDRSGRRLDVKRWLLRHEGAARAL